MNAIVISDSGPLITLAKANNLDVLLKQQLPIQIPDAVIVETAQSQRADSLEIARWVNSHPDRVTIVVTEKGVEQIARLSAGESVKNYGEKAAVEAATAHLNKDPSNKAFLLYEDNDARIEARKDPRITLLPTAAFLKGLEIKAEIPSARDVLQQAAATGRNMDNQIAHLSTPQTEKAVSQFVAQQVETKQNPGFRSFEQVFPDQVQNFSFKYQHPDGVKTYEHKQTHGLLHIDPEGQTRSKHGESISPQKALESALAPAQEKSNGAGKSNDSGQGFGI